MQEFFTANYVLSKIESQKNLIEEHLGDTRWREVIIAVATLLSEADDYIIMILSKMISMGFAEQYVGVLKAYISNAGSTAAKSGAIIQSVTSKRNIGSYTGANITHVELQIAKRKAKLLGNGLNVMLRQVGERFALEGTDLLVIPSLITELKPYHIIPTTKKSGIIDYIRAALKKVNETIYERAADYVESWVYHFHACLVVNGIGWNGAVSRVLRDKLTEAIEMSVGTAAVRIERELRTIAAAETLVEILQSSAYVSRAVRDAAVKTLAGGPSARGWG